MRGGDYDSDEGRLETTPGDTAATLGAEWGAVAPTPETSAAQARATPRRAEVTDAPEEEKTEVPATWTTPRAATGERSWRRSATGTSAAAAGAAAPPLETEWTSERAKVLAVPATERAVPAPATAGPIDAARSVTVRSVSAMPEPAPQKETAADTGTTTGPPVSVATAPGESDSLGIATSTPDTSLSGEEIADPEQAEDNSIGVNVDDTSKIHEFLPRLNEILRSGSSNDNWKRFQETLTDITERVKVLAKIPVSYSNNTRKPTANPEDPKWLQKAYKRNRRKTIRTILGDESMRCEINKDRIESHFKNMAVRKRCDTRMYGEMEAPEVRNSVSTSRITPEEVASKLKRYENTDPGDDRITYKHWKTVDPACTVLAAVYNICLKYERIPDTWRKSLTTLIHKKSDPNDITNWRPIAILRTIYKLFAGVMAKRLSNWIDQNAVLAPAQKGFVPHDGVFEHSYTLRRLFDRGRTEK
jgi:hypothetical protein